MLSLNRKEGETLWIGPVEIKIINIARGQARISINCPDGYEILRGELVGKTPANLDRFDIPVPRPTAPNDEGTTELVVSGKEAL